MKTELQLVADQLAELQDKQMRLQAEEFRQKTIPALKELVGKTFVYRNNSYGEEKFDSFRKLLTVTFSAYHAWAIFEECQIDCHGRVRLETQSELVSSTAGLRFVERGWGSCDSAEYEGVRKAALSELSEPNLYVNYLARP